jgi:hypothetical protein
MHCVPTKPSIFLGTVDLKSFSRALNLKKNVPAFGLKKGGVFLLWSALPIYQRLVKHIELLLLVAIKAELRSFVL